LERDSGKVSEDEYDKGVAKVELRYESMLQRLDSTYQVRSRPS
jgi:hypothetical protein